MPLPEILRLAEAALSGQPSPQYPEDLLRAILEQTSSRAGVLRHGDVAVARWPRTVTKQVEEATDGWTEVPMGGDGRQWLLRILKLERLDESVLSAARLALRAWEIREELKRTRFDVRFHLWELEAIRSIATNIGCINDRSQLAEEIINHLVALLGVRTARLYLGPQPESATCVGSFGPQVLSVDDLAEAWHTAVYRDDVVALPLNTDNGVLGVLVAANKEARAGTEPLAANDLRLLELFALQVTVALEYARLTQESLERERLRQELEMAAVIQSHLYPQHFPDFPGFRLAVRNTSSRQVAGDTYDVLLRNGSLIVTITDVSGKGVGAGMIASGVHAGVRLIVDSTLDLTDLASRINHYLVGSTADNRFATFALVRVDRDGRLTVINAGHCPVLIRRRDGSIDQVNSSGLPLGIMRSATYSEERTTLEPGDLLFLYTDGLTEAESPDEEEFSVERVAKVAAGLDGSGADEACNVLLEQVNRHTEGRPLQDDATLLVLERLAD